MSGTILAAAMLSLGVGYTWQKLPEADGGGFEYIIQLKPEDLAAMKTGQDAHSDIPPNLRGARSYRVTLRSDLVPQVGTPEQTSSSKDQEPTKPWAPFSLALAALLASIGCNLFLGWITLETRSRYRRLLHTGGEDPVSDNLDLPDEDDPFRDLQDPEE